MHELRAALFYPRRRGGDPGVGQTATYPEGRAVITGACMP